MQSNCTIVGGGISGLLLALRLSHNKVKLSLLEEKPELGGRLFAGTAESAFGFEILNLAAKKNLFNYIQKNLTQEENLQLIQHLAYFDIKTEQINSCFFVKKSLICYEDLLNKTNDFLSLKERNYLNQIITQPESEFAASYQNGNLPKIIQAIVGEDWQKIPFSKCCIYLKNFFTDKKNNYLGVFSRQIALEKFLEKILLARDVKIKKSCKLVDIKQDNENNFQLAIQDIYNPEKKYLYTNQLIFAIPLVQLLGIIPEKMYSVSQAKFIAKTRQSSMLLYELNHFSKIKAANINLKNYDSLIFPIERCQAFYTCADPNNDRLIIYQDLDYELSMQAPAVRESLSLLKKAAIRLVKTEIVTQLKRAAQIPQDIFLEKISLLTLGYNLNLHNKTYLGLEEVQMKATNVYCCGDNFSQSAEDACQGILNSIEQVYNLICK